MSIFDDWKADLWLRWQHQFSRMDALLKSPHTGRVVYARTFAYDLEKFTATAFKTSARLSRQPLPDSFRYWLDAQKRPIRMAYRHPYRSDVDMHGFFEYSAEQAEYVEYNAPSGVPGHYAVSTIEDGHVTSFRSLRLNGSNDPPAWRGISPAARAQKLRENPGFYGITLKQCTIEEGRIHSEQGYAEGMGMMPVEYRNSYSYSEDGKLQRITSDSGALVFEARPRRTLSRLRATLTTQIADAVLDLLTKLPQSAPLSMVELSYSSGNGYVPAVVVHTETTDAPFPPDWTKDQFFQLSSEAFDLDIEEFDERIGRTEQWEAGGKMLRDVARLVNARIAQIRPVTADFCANAMDWEVEGHDAAQIFRECGVRNELVDRWLKAGRF